MSNWPSLYSCLIPTWNLKRHSRFRWLRHWLTYFFFISCTLYLSFTYSNPIESHNFNFFIILCRNIIIKPPNSWQLNNYSDKTRSDCVNVPCLKKLFLTRLKNLGPWKSFPGLLMVQICSHDLKTRNQKSVWSMKFEILQLVCWWSDHLLFVATWNLCAK